MSKEVVLVVGGGGRESALVDKYGQSLHVGKIISISDNDLIGINTEKEVKIFPKRGKKKLETTDIFEIMEICREEKVTYIDPAQDNAIEAGLVDAARKQGIPVAGPTRLAGQIEWDKAWAREFGERHEIPQPFFKICLSTGEGIDFLKDQPDQPWFIKAAYLAEGKGALPARNNKEAAEKIIELKERFGKKANIYLIEKWLKNPDGSNGEEFSIFVFSDGQNYKVIGSAQDHKRVDNFDEGENTGGMGCSSPPLVLTPELMENIQLNILNRAILGMREEGRAYKGVLYLGGILIKQEDNLKPYVIEFNARWGDPEAQVILPGLINDLYEIGMSIAEGNLDKINLQLDGKSRVVITGASKGYPGDYKAVMGKEITGLNNVMRCEDVRLYGAGVKKVGDKYFANSGRLFYIVGEGNSIIEARRKAYDAMSIISVQGNNLHYRTDIGWRDIERFYHSST